MASKTAKTPKLQGCQLSWVVYRNCKQLVTYVQNIIKLKFSPFVYFFPGGQDPSSSTKRVAEKLHNQNRIDGIETTYGVKIQ